MQALRDDAELRRKQEIHEAEESKNAHIQDLMKKHEKVLLLLSTPFRSVTLHIRDNLAHLPFDPFQASRIALSKSLKGVLLCIARYAHYPSNPEEAFVL